MMSLLNDMLRDLSHQHTPKEAPAVMQESAQGINAQEQRELFYHTRAAKPLPRTFVPSLVIFFLVLILFSLWKANVFSGSDASESIVSDDLAAKSTATTIAPSSTPMLPNTIPGATVTPGNNSQSPELGARIAALESAINNLSAAVANNSAPLDEAQIIADPDFALNSIADGTSDTSFVESDSFFVQADEGISESVSIQEPFAQAVAQPLSDQSQAELSSPEQEQGEAQFSIEPNIKWQDSQQAQQASQLVAQGQATLAMEKLQAYIATAAKPYQSTKALLDIFATQENISAMQNLLAQADYLSAIDKTFYAAKIAIIQEQESQAITQLEANLDQAENDENYRALLAGLYQRSGMQMEASNHYRRLLSTFGDKPTYWLGFALAQDALDQSAVAVQAYQRVNQYADLQPQVRTYIQQRISALQQ